MMQPFNQKDHDNAVQKMSLIKSFLGPDLDVALTVLAYTLAEIGIGSDVTFHSIVKNLALIWEQVEDSHEGEDDAND
jgi:hypothetical protein